jgi:hypothetical protein
MADFSSQPRMRGYFAPDRPARAGAEVGRVILPFCNATQVHGAWFGAQDLSLT